jgi:hypothetical protein
VKPRGGASIGGGELCCVAVGSDTLAGRRTMTMGMGCRLPAWKLHLTAWVANQHA